MAKNTGKGYRQRAIRDRSQTYNPVTGQLLASVAKQLVGLV
jgi:hypothetical protein